MTCLAPAVRRSARRERHGRDRTMRLNGPVAASVGIHGVALAALLAVLASDPGRRPPVEIVVALEQPVILEESPPLRETPPPVPPEPAFDTVVLEDLLPPDAGDPRIADDGRPSTTPARAPDATAAVFGLGAGPRASRRSTRREGEETPFPSASGAPGGGDRGGLQPATTGPAVRARPIEEACGRPDYPSRERRRGIEGVVELLVAVTAAGGVESVEVTSSSGSDALDRAALEAVTGWRFSPALQDGVPVADTVRLRVRFTLVAGSTSVPGG